MTAIGIGKQPIGQIVDHQRDRLAAEQRHNRCGIAEAQQASALHMAGQHELFPDMAMRVTRPFHLLGGRLTDEGPFHLRRAQIEIADIGIGFAHQADAQRHVAVRNEVIDLACDFTCNALNAGRGLHQEAPVDDQFPQLVRHYYPRTKRHVVRD